MKPMLAAAVKDLKDVRYPVLVSPKYDGIRAVVLNGVVLGRSFKPIPNHWVQTCFGKKELNGLDGELVVGNPTSKRCFSVTSSGVMAKTGVPRVTFYVFDDILLSGGATFYDRFLSVKRRLFLPGGNYRHDHVELVSHNYISGPEAAAEQETSMIEDGYEGMMLRDPRGPYKFGRSTLKEGYLLKLKRFEDSEAKVTGMTELMHNANEATIDYLGHQVRSSHQANKKGLGTMGSIVVQDIKTGVIFEIGTGFTQQDRDWFWAWGKTGVSQNYPPRLVVKYKYQPVGVKDKPRFPVYLGLRDPVDAGAP